MIKFQDPPPSATRRGLHEKIAAKLRKRPGEWALIQHMSSTHNVDMIQRGRVKPYQPAGSFEATSRKRDEGYDIYARYVGEVSA